MSKKVFLLTGNPSKLAAAQKVFDEFNIEIESLPLNLAEVQAPTSAEIAEKAAIEAYRMTGKPVIREDHSFYIDALGIPGPFMAYVDKAIDPDTLLKILDVLPSRDGHFLLAATYVDETGECHNFEYSVPVEFAHEVRGREDLRWERIIKFKDDDRTFAEYPEEERTDVWAKNYRSIAELISSS